MDKEQLKQLLLEVLRESKQIIFEALYPGSDSVSNSGSAVTVSTQVRIFENNPQRWIASIVNNSANTVYVTLLGASGAVGITLTSYGTFTFGRGTDFKYTGALAAYAAVASSLTLTEVNVPTFQ